MIGAARLLLMCALASCGGGEVPTTTSFADHSKTLEWFNRMCGPGRISISFRDAAAPPEHSDIEAFECFRALGDISAPRVELRGTPLRLCAIEIGPSRVTKPIDPSFIAEWFDDKALGERAALAVRDLYPHDAYRRVTVVDGITIAIVQKIGAVEPAFFLSVDGCGRVADRGDSLVF